MHDAPAPDHDSYDQGERFDLASGLVDVRVEDGRIRAVLPAGAAPCCAPGMDAGGGRLRPLNEACGLAAGEPADFRLETPDGGAVVFRAGRVSPGA